MQFRLSIAALTVYAFTGSTHLANAADSVQNASGASTHASQSVTVGIPASAQATLGLSAVPLLSVGAVGSAVGAVSTAAGKASSAAAAGLPANSPLPLTDEVITVIPISEALKSRSPITAR